MNNIIYKDNKWFLRQRAVLYQKNNNKRKKDRVIKNKTYAYANRQTWMK